jgi:hypothetical protein
MRGLTVWVAGLNKAGDIGIVSPTSAHEYLVNVLARSIASIMIDDRLGRDPGCCSDNVVRGQPFGFGTADEVVCQAVSEYLTARATVRSIAD